MGVVHLRVHGVGVNCRRVHLSLAVSSFLHQILPCSLEEQTLDEDSDGAAPAGLVKSLVQIIRAPYALDEKEELLQVWDRVQQISCPIS